MSITDSLPNSIVGLLDTKLDLLKSDLSKNTHAANSILKKIIDIEDPVLSKTVSELKAREASLHAQIDYLLEERILLKREIVKMYSKTRSLRKCALIITVVIAVLVIASIMYASELVMTKTNEILDQKTNRLDSMAIRVEQEILDLQSILEISARLPQIQDVPSPNLIERDFHGVPGNAESAKREVANNILATNHNISTVYFVLPNGDTYMSQPYHIQENLADSNFAFRDWYKGVTETHETYLSEIFLSQGSGDRALALVTPVYSRGMYIGILGAILDVAHVTNQFQELPLEKNERLIVLDHHKNIVYDSQYPYNSKQIARFSDIKILNVLDSKYPDNIVRMNGVESLVLSHSIYATNNNWSVILIQPTEDAFADAHRMFSFVVIVIGVLGSISFGLGMFILRSTKPRQNFRTEYKNEPEYEKIKPRSRYGKKILALIIVISIALAVFATLYFTKSNDSQPIVRSKFVIENLRGDTVDIWISWRLSKGEPLSVRFLNPDEVSKEQIDAIKDSLLSEDSVIGDDSLVRIDVSNHQSKYYKGWLGALKAASQETKFNIPVALDVGDSINGEGDIIFHFARTKDADGYAGYTKSITDDNQILKATITIYDVESLSPDQIATIARHEFGHALGLAHSTATEDLMAPTITTPTPYISECDVDALHGLYDGIQNSQVICQK